MKLNLFYAFVCVCGAIDAASNDTNSTDDTTTRTAITTPIQSTTLPSTVTPTTSPCPDVWHVSYQNSPKDYCIIMKANLAVTITTDGKKVDKIVLNQTSPNTGYCQSDSKTENITIMDFSGLHLTWTFTHTGSDAFNVTNIEVSFNGSRVNEDVSDLWLDNINSKKMFQCNAQETIMNQTSNSTTFVVTVSSLKLMAFQNVTTCALDTNNYASCDADGIVSNLVPIIVGACLGGLIVIVLIAYLVGRRRSRRGYESV